MRLPLALIIPLTILFGLVDWYVVRAVWKRCTHYVKFWRSFAVGTTVFCFAMLAVAVLMPKTTTGDGQLNNIMWTLYVLLAVYFAKIVFIAFDLLSKIPRLWKSTRIKALSWVGVVLGVALLLTMYWGVFINRFSIQTTEVTITRSELPNAFDGFTIAQISDFHTGTYGTDTSFVCDVVETINSLKPDMIVFTGDIVNRHSTELKPFVSTLSKLRAPHGVYSILGNHDYGDYYRWPDSATKAENMKLLYRLQEQAGFKLLNNATEFITKDSDTLALIGVENIGDPPFPTYGNLEAAYPGNLADDRFKILLSHNPAHWAQEIANSANTNIALTLSGHTHAMQIELFGWSPAKYRYRTWGGLYADNDSTHLLYVNIGLGEVGMPARIGATPEITVFTLHK